MTSVRIVLAFNTENANKGFPYWHFDGILPIAIKNSNYKLSSWSKNLRGLMIGIPRKAPKSRR